MTDFKSATRRRFAQLLASGVSVGLAGCSGLLSPESSPLPWSDGVATSGVVESVELSGSVLAVTMAETPAVSDVRVRGPDGDVWSAAPVSGQSAHTVDLFAGGAYPPGTQTVEARDSGGDIVGSATVPLVPDVRVTAFGLGSQFRDRLLFPADVERPEKVPVVQVENTGTGPDRVAGLELRPARDAYTPTAVRGSRLLTPDSTGLVYNEYTTFFEGYDVDRGSCGETHTWALTVTMAAGDDLTRTVEISGEPTADTDAFLIDSDCRTTGSLPE